MEKEEIQKRMHFLKKQILTMEWDEQRNQLNSGRKSYLEKVREEYKELELQLEPAN